MDETPPTWPLPPAQPQEAPPQPNLHNGQHAQQYVAEPFYKRHGLGFAISTMVLGAIVLIGVVGVGTVALSSVVFRAGSSVSQLLRDGGQQVPEQPQPPGRDGDGQRGKQGPNTLGGVRGSVTKISDSTWTVETQRGLTVTVETNSSTVYGTPGQSQKASDFVVGDNVIVLGTRTDDVVTASRILKVSELRGAPPQLPGSTATPEGSSAS